MNEQPKTPPSGGDPTPGRPSPGPMAQNAAERLAVIIDAVERAATGVIDDAEAQAKRHLEQARARAERVADERKRQADELIAAFGVANAELGVSPEPEAPEQAPPADPGEGAEPAAPQEEASGARPQLSHLKPVDPPKPPIARSRPGFATSWV